MESLAIHEVFGDRVPVSSTKPLTGHTLGAAGANEAALCWLSLSSHNTHGSLPPHIWDADDDDKLPALKYVTNGSNYAPIRNCLSNSFAFGGNNASLILGKLQ